MFQKILLPVDLSDRHEPALTRAAELARPGEGQVILLHVIETIAGLSVEEERDFYQRLERSARAHLARLGAQLQERVPTWRAEIIYGNPGPEILRYAEKNEIDLIILTTPRLEAVRPVGLGSLSYKLVPFVDCPLLLVK
jgi:nucleotide-binding universal stress UspA family protein